MFNRLFAVIVLSAAAQHAVPFIGMTYAAPAPEGDMQARSVVLPSPTIEPPMPKRAPLVPEEHPDEVPPAFAEMRQDGVRADEQQSCWLTKCSSDSDCNKLLLKDPAGAKSTLLKGHKESRSDSDDEDGGKKKWFISLAILKKLKSLKDDEYVPCSEGCQDMGGKIGKVCFDQHDAWNVQQNEKLGNDANSHKSWEAWVKKVLDGGKGGK
ncbi:hypothetical protein F4810DRAFT_715387 [Camillea tinctor]|nr:hypothetical protein F4810DRAFT_715387 [Camillea tinctor]